MLGAEVYHNTSAESVPSVLSDGLKYGTQGSNY
jgi:RNA:NAD 2'-phosphotransferase (TPT1/KptA family)